MLRAQKPQWLGGTPRSDNQAKLSSFYYILHAPHAPHVCFSKAHSLYFVFGTSSDRNLAELAEGMYVLPQF